MRTIISILFLITMYSGFAQENTLNIQFNKNIDFLGYILELGDPSDNDPNHPLTKLLKVHPEDLQNPLLGEIFTLGAEINYATLVNLMYLLPEFPLNKNYELSRETAIYLGYDTDEKLAVLTELIEKVNTFYLESGFESVWGTLPPFQKEVKETLWVKSPTPQLLAEMEFYYQKDFDSYLIIPSLCMFSGPGWGIQKPQTNEAVFVLGPLEKNFDFTSERFYELSIHEFGHPFANPVVLNFKDHINSSESLFSPLKEAMVPQGYRDWISCIIEHFVRAGEVIISERQGKHKTSNELLESYSKERQFIYLPYIVKQLKKYRFDQGLSYSVAVEKTLVDLQSNFVKAP